MNILVPMAGLGKRFADVGYKNPKPLIYFNGATMIEHVIDNLNIDGARYIFVIHSDHNTDKKLEHVINRKKPNSKVIEINYITEGPACTCLIAKPYINEDEELIIINCDQIIEDFNQRSFEKYITHTCADGVLGVFNCINRKNSYVKLDSNYNVIEAKEKEIISPYATNGFHYWKKAQYFFESAEKMIKSNDRTDGEFYIAPTYNYMVKDGYTVKTYHFNLHFPIGIPVDLDKYVRLKEDEKI